jgi:hypothetical protein
MKKFHNFLNHYFQKVSLSGDDSEDFYSKQIELEERKLLVAQRKLESIRILDEILERVKVIWHFNRHLIVVFKSQRSIIG